MEVSSFIGGLLSKKNILAITGVGFDTYACAYEFCRENHQNARGPLQIILGLRPEESKFFKERGNKLHKDNPLKYPAVYSLTNDNSTSEREDLYRRRGVFVVTSRILVGDLLSLTLPPGLIFSVFVSNYLLSLFLSVIKLNFH
eukprot:GDKK01066045.1.p1 GENE.GDKK01066045.1~~GDKK01066045.1.p1  ORF type:complete len:157 (+),score=4.71 GDKK01066045.1:44-472(+)